MRIALLLPCLLCLGCDVGGSSSVGGSGTSGPSSGGAGGGFPGCIEVDCSNEANQQDPRCDYTAEPGDIGDGPPFLGQSPDLRRGFLDGDTLYVAYESGSDIDGAIFTVNATTGLRTFISGVIEDPVTGPDPKGSGPDLTTLWDLARGPGGELYALADNNMGRQVLSIDEASGDRELVVSLATPPCVVGGESVQIKPQLEIRASTGSILLIGSANGGSGLFEIDPGSGVCTTISFASGDENNVGDGPLFYDFQSLALDGEKAYVSDSATASLVEIVLATGNRLRVSSADSATPVGDGPYAGSESTLASSGRAQAAREDFSGSGILVETDLSTGDRTEFLSMGGPISNPSKFWLYGEKEGCFYFGGGNTVYVFHAASGLSNRISR